MACAPILPNPPIGVEGLAAALCKAIREGNGDLAKKWVARLTYLQPKLQITFSKAGNDDEQGNGKKFRVIVNVTEPEESYDIKLTVRVSDTISDLKQKMLELKNIPIDRQKWIIGKRIPQDSMTLRKCGLIFEGCTLYLYIVKLCPIDKRDSEYDSGDLESVTYSFIEDKIASNSLLMNSNSVIQEPKSFPVASPSVFQIDNTNFDVNAHDTEETRVVTIAKKVPMMEEEKSSSFGWECKICTFVNLPTRPGCEMCTADRPDDFKMPDGYQMTDEEIAQQAHQEELERQVSESHEATLRENFQQWLSTENFDLIPNTTEFDCPICCCDFGPGEGVILRGCLHQFCKDCLQNALGYNEEPCLKCPSDEHCDNVLQDREVRALVSEEMFNKYLQRGLDQAESQAGNSFHCKSTDCKGWCLYEDEINFFKCPICKMINCLTCKVIHEGMNCKEYQANLAIKAANDVAAKKTQDLIKQLLANGTAMHCPRCQIVVQKKDGCDWVMCSVCKVEICWVTKGRRWGPKGQGDTSGGCRCGVNNVRCHPTCGNCH